ncbi:MAG: thermonuclease family protein [Deltaproteobacteria bacterium]|nr:thermonuclease family protein [Deltaproteobacteria bacterium]
MYHNIGHFESSIAIRRPPCHGKKWSQGWLAGYDASEKGKKGAAQARKDLSAMILGQEIAVEKVATDKYKRTVARVKLGRNSVNKAMKEKLGG